MRRWGTIGVLLLCLVLAGATACNPFGEGDKEEASQQLIKVIRGDLTVSVSGSGNIKASREARLSFGSGGRIDKVYVKEGYEVSKGKVLARLDTSALELARTQAQVAVTQAQVALTQAQVAVTQKQVALTQAQVALTQAQVAVTQAQAAHAQAQVTVTEAEVAVTRAEVAVTQAQAAHTQAQVTVTEAEVAVTRAEVAVTQAQAAHTQAQAAVTQAQVAVQTAEYEQNKAQETYTLSDIKKRQVEAAQQSLEAARQSLELAKQSLELAKLSPELAQQSLESTRRALELAKLSPELAQQSLEAARQSLELAKLSPELAQQSLEAARQSLEATRQSLEATRQALELAKLSPELAQQSVELAQQSLNEAQKKLDEATIIAPFDGVVASVGADEGDTVSTVATIVHLIDPTSMELIIELDEIDIPVVKLNQQAIIEIDALPDITLKGRVASIYPLPTTKGGVVLYNVKINLDVPEGSTLRIGMSASADIIITKRSNILLVPSRVIEEDSQGKPLVKVMVNEQIQERAVVIGISDGLQTEIISGLGEGETVVIETRVKPKPSGLGLL